MASIINASTSGAGGLISTADNSGVLNLQSGGTTVASVTSSGLAVTGTLLVNGVAPTGKLIQVVQATYTAEFSTTSTSFVATGLTASITPSSSSNKILVMVNTTQTCTSASTNTYFTVYRGATNIGFGTDSSLAKYVATSGYVITPVAINYLDSPATTAATTYTGYFRTTGGTGYVNSSTSGTITLMEIAA